MTYETNEKNEHKTKTRLLLDHKPALRFDVDFSQTRSNQP